MNIGLVRGVDFQFVGDEDLDYIHIIQKSNVASNDRAPIWDIFDNIINHAVSEEGLLGGMEPVCEAIEDYCKFAGIVDIPPLYQYIFNARGGFLTQSKAIYFLKNDWNVMFPTWKNKNVKDTQLENYLEANGISAYVKSWLLCSFYTKKSS